MVELTKKVVEALALPEGESERIVWDDELPGFGIRLRRRADGTTAKTYRAQFRVGRQQRAPNIGDVRKVSLDDARKAARILFGKAAAGIDPGIEKDAAKRALVSSKNTLERVAKLYLAAKKDVLRPSTFQQTQRFLLQQWAPLHGQPIENIQRAQIAARLHELARAHGRASASRSRGVLSTFFAWAMREGFCEANPVIATNDPGAGTPARERVLDDTEIRAIWNACQQNDFGRIVRLLILTGCRREEIGQLRWSEINMDTGVMTIPGTRTKNKRELQLPLSPAAIDILRSAKPAEGRAYVFGRSGTDSGFAGWAWSKLALDSRITNARGKASEPYVLHDLRRTMRTGLGKLGIPPHIAELTINHAKGGIVAVYDRYSYQPQIKAALATWADHVTGLVEGRDQNVIPLQRA